MDRVVKAEFGYHLIPPRAEVQVLQEEINDLLRTRKFVTPRQTMLQDRLLSHRVVIVDLLDSKAIAKEEVPAATRDRPDGWHRHTLYHPERKSKKELSTVNFLQAKREIVGPTTDFIRIEQLILLTREWMEKSTMTFYDTMLKPKLDQLAPESFVSGILNPDQLSAEEVEIQTTHINKFFRVLPYMVPIGVYSDFLKYLEENGDVLKVQWKAGRIVFFDAITTAHSRPPYFGPLSGDLYFDQI